MKQLQGRVAVVTGAGSGIGRATAEILSRKGCAVALVDVDETGLRETASRIRDTGRSASEHLADVSDRERMRALPDEVIREHAHVHVLVNNAGVTVAGTFEAHSFEDFDWIVGVNFWGVVHGCKFFLPHLLREDEAHIVNVSSMAAFLGLPLQSAYCATKSAVRGLSEALGAELAGTSVGVTSVHPGATRTAILRGSRGADPAALERWAAQLERHARAPEHVGSRIVSAIERGRRRVVVGIEARVTDWAASLLPVLSQRLLGASFRRRPP